MTPLRNGLEMTQPVTEYAGHTLIFETGGPGFTDITHEISAWLEMQSVHAGLLTVFVAHTSASLTIQENADPDVLLDLSDALERIASRSHPYRHSSEGRDDMPAHIRSMVTSTSLSIPIQDGRMALGTWQGIYLVEHRDAPHRRRITLNYLGSSREL
jgi:secondary thiamine-phosphate synthase enzyme